MENQFREQNFKFEGSTNGYIIHIAIGSNRLKGAAAGPSLVRAHQGCGHTLPGVSGTATAPTAPSSCPLPLSAGAPSYKYRELGLRLSSPSHSLFSPPLSPCSTTCKNSFQKAQVQGNSVEIS